MDVGRDEKQKSLRSYFPFWKFKERSPLVIGVSDDSRIYFEARDGVRVIGLPVDIEEVHSEIYSIAKELVGFRGYDMPNLSDFLDEEEVAEILKIKSID